MFSKSAVLALALIALVRPAAAATPLETCTSRDRGTPTDAAIAACTEALEGNLSAKTRGRVLVKRGEWRTKIDDASDAALADFTKALEVDPNSRVPYILRAQVHVEAERYDAALADIAVFLKRDQGDPFAWIVSARANLGAGNTEKAISELTRALKLDPKGADILYYRGLAHRAAANNDKALADFEKALDIKSNYLAALQAHAAVLVGLGEHERALVDYDKITQLPVETDVWLDTRLLRAKSYDAMDRYDEALTELDEILLFHPEHEAKAYLAELEARLVRDGLLKPEAVTTKPPGATTTP